MIRVLALICLVVLTGNGILRAEPPKAQATVAQVQAWLTDLDSDDYARRESAGAHLQAAGVVAIPGLVQAIAGDSPEASWRAAEVLKGIAARGDASVAEQILTALETNGAERKRGLERFAAELKLRQKQLRHLQAAKRIKELGGHVSGNQIAEVPSGLGMPVFVEIVDEITTFVVGPAIEPAGGSVAGEAVALPEGAGSVLLDTSESVVDEPAPPPDAAPPAEEPPGSIGFIGEAYVDLEGGGLTAEEPVGVDAPAEHSASVSGGEVSLNLDARWRGGDEGLRVAAELDQLTSVRIVGAKLSDESLQHLCKMPQLKRLEVQGTSLSREALLAFRKERPEASVYAQGRGVLGVHCGMDGPCVLSGVQLGSGAQKAGLQTGDTIVSAGGHDIRDFSDLTISIYSHEPGDEVPVEFERDGKRHKVVVTLQQRKQ